MILSCVSFLVYPQKSMVKSLVPQVSSNVPDYFCTWNLQGYVVSYCGSDSTRKALTEEYLFGDKKYQGWTNCYPTIRKDMFFVMDDSWDIPKDVNSVPNEYLGMAELSHDRFPSFKGEAIERLKKLTDSIKSLGWKGVGGWICAQKPQMCAQISERDYWKQRIAAMNLAGFDYWKVDWGYNDRNGIWRKMLTEIGKHHAPHLWVEHAMVNEFIEFSDVFRTYDVENIIAQPVTIQRVCGLLPYKPNKGAKGLINCEDEPYIAAGLGCVIGVMRHPFAGALPNGLQDFVFPPVGRDIKHRLDEVVRGIRWHRIAEPFGVGVEKNFFVDSVKLKDMWILGEKETWQTGRAIGSVITAEAPARVSRGLPLPWVSDSVSADRPFILASCYPNGAVAIVSVGRSIGRNYSTKEISVRVQLETLDRPIGIFGYFSEVCLVFSSAVKWNRHRIFAQDLASDNPIDITCMIKAENNKIKIPGDVIRRIGLMNASKGDCSDPGLVLQIK